jgi:hypothetical protein
MLKIGTTGKPISNDFIIGELNKYGIGMTGKLDTLNINSG